MARVVSRSRPREVNGMRIQFSELIVLLFVVGALAYAARWYFMVYRVSAPYTLNQYLGAIKHGNVEEQYALVDAADKGQFYPTMKDYEKNAKQSRGYTARLQNFDLSDPQPDAKNPNLVKIKARLSVRGGAASTSGGVEGLGLTEAKTVEDQYALRKDSNGKWKVVLSKSDLKLLTIPPSPPGDPIG